MKIKKIGVLTERNEIVGQMHPIVLSILRNLPPTKKPGTWYTIAKALLPENDAPKPPPVMPVNCEARNMLFGPWEPPSLSPLWTEDLVPKAGCEEVLRSAGSRVGRLATFSEFVKLLRRHNWFEDPTEKRVLTQKEREEAEGLIAESRREIEAEEMGREIETPLWDKANAEEREELIKRIKLTAQSDGLSVAIQKEMEREAIFKLLDVLDLPGEQFMATMSASEEKLAGLRERAHREGRVKGRLSIRIRDAILQHQLKQPVSFTSPTFQRVDGEYVALVVFQRRLFLVTAPYLDSESANEAALQVKKLAYSEDHRLKRLRQQVEAAENAESRKGLQRNAIPQDVQRFVWTRDDGKCVRCGSRENLQYDHIIPFAKGGGYTEANIQLLCKHCNLQKSDGIGF